MLRAAAEQPETLFVGVDANHAALRSAFSLAARRRLDNVLFVVASAESLPLELAGRIDEVRVQFPWGSLLRLVLAADSTFVSHLGSMLRPGGRLALCLSLTDRDRIGELRSLDAASVDDLGYKLAAASGGLLTFDRAVAITEQMVDRLHSTWAKRLRVGRTRPGWMLELSRWQPLCIAPQSRWRNAQPSASRS